uniref:Transcription factor CBF/NF-Y/archaeal histone domain-containing protein n=1 Tax=Chenopodium quinoa TaxID=63459 RepID=A0A803MRZ3_CHEQI
MKKALVATIQECVLEFISFITGETSDKCQKEKRKTINGDDLLWAMKTLGLEEYVEPLKVYLHKYRELEGETMTVFGERLDEKDLLVHGVMEYEGGFTNIFNDVAEDLNASHLKMYLGYDETTFDPFISLLVQYGMIHIYCEREVTAILEPNCVADYIFDEELYVGSKMSFTVLLQHDDEDTFKSHEKAKNIDKDYEEELKQIKRVVENKRKQPKEIDSEYEDSTDLDSLDDASDEEDCRLRDELPSSTQPLTQLQQKGKKQKPLQTAAGFSISEPRRQAAY